jgi:cytochrome c553
LFRKIYVGLPLAAAALVWLVTGCSTGSSPSAAHGKELFKTCVPCHGEKGAGNETLRAPSIAGLPEWYVRAQLAKFKGAIRGAHPDDAEGARMRPMARTLYHPGDVESVAEYVSSMPTVPVGATLTGDPTAGQAHYAVCLACHGPQARGNEALHAPPLADRADWYMLAQLEKFKNGLRGMDPRDTTGTMMHAMAMTLPDQKAMLDVVAYIKTLGAKPGGGN